MRAYASSTLVLPLSTSSPLLHSTVHCVRCALSGTHTGPHLCPLVKQVRCAHHVNSTIDIMCAPVLARVCNYLHRCISIQCCIGATDVVVRCANSCIGVHHLGARGVCALNTF